MILVVLFHASFSQFPQHYPPLPFCPAIYLVTLLRLHVLILFRSFFSPLWFDFRSSSTSFFRFQPPFISSSLPSNHIASSLAAMLKPSRARGIAREQRCSRARRGLTRACAIVLQWAMQADAHGVARKDGGIAAAAAGVAGRAAMIGQRGVGESGDKTGTRQRRTPNGAMALPPQQRRRSRLNGRLASPRLAL